MVIAVLCFYVWDSFISLYVLWKSYGLQVCAHWCHMLPYCTDSIVRILVNVSILWWGNFRIWWHSDLRVSSQVWNQLGGFLHILNLYQICNECMPSPHHSLVLALSVDPLSWLGATDFPSGVPPPCKWTLLMLLRQVEARNAHNLMP